MTGRPQTVSRQRFIGFVLVTTATSIDPSLRPRGVALRGVKCTRSEGYTEHTQFAQDSKVVRPQDGLTCGESNQPAPIAEATLTSAEVPTSFG